MNNYINLKNKVAIVTGAGKGTGKVIAIALAKAGAKLVVNDIDLRGIKRVAEEITSLGGEVQFVEADVSRTGQVDRIVEAAINHYEKIDILVNNAGIFRKKNIENLEENEWDEVVSVNLKGVYLCCRVVARYMKKQKKGKIVNISSIAAKTGGFLVGAHYSASKAGVIALSKSLARELAPHNINVNAVAPGIIDTETTRRIFTSEEILQMIEGIPLRRLALPEDVAGCVLFLISDAADYLTGITLDVNGGQLMD